MVKGRGSAASWSAQAIMALMVVSVLVLLEADYVQAVTYTVGESNVWTFEAEGWPNGKSFKAGDILVFNYDPMIHNVVVVDSESNYKNCVTPRGARTYNSGKDHITLSKGQHFFICNFPGHCQRAMKISVTAV